VDVPHAERFRMDFLTHEVFGYSFGVSRIVRWLVRLRIFVARPIALGR
jgi:hypothetical protein